MIKFVVMTFMYDEWANSEYGSHTELIRAISKTGAEGIEAFCSIFTGNKQLIEGYKREMENTGLKMPVMDLITNLACKRQLG